MGAIGFVNDPETATVKSAKRVLQILELFGERRCAMSTTDIALQLNYPISSTAALLKSLASLGYLYFDRRSRAYEASLRVGLLGGWMHSHGKGFGRLDRITDRLAVDSRQTVVLAIRNDIHIQYVKVLSPDSNVRFYLPVGSRQRLVDTIMGRSLLALEDDAFVERLVWRANAERTAEQNSVDLAVIREEIAEIRKSGHIYSSNAFFSGAAVVAATLDIDAADRTVVLGIGGPVDEMEAARDQLIAMVMDAVREMEMPTDDEDMLVWDDEASAKILRFA
jgi:DNA-binding IclR family transcriptional regulator